MADTVILSAAVRTNLLSLQGTTKLIDRTQKRLSTGLETNWPADDAVAFFQAKGLSDRATDFTEKKDGIDQGISALNAAITGAAGIEGMVRQLKGLVLNAKSATSESIGGIVAQFNDLRVQINSLAQDTAYQGLNLINGTGSNLEISFSNATSAMLNVPSVDCTVGVKGLDIRKAATANGGFNLAFAGNTGTTLMNNTVITTEFAGTGTTFSAGSYTVTYGTSDITFTVGTAGATTTTLTNTESFAVGDPIYVRRATDVSTIENSRAVMTRGNASSFPVEFSRNSSAAISAGATLSLTWAGTGNSLASGDYDFSFGSGTITVTISSAGSTQGTFTTTEVFSQTEGAFIIDFFTAGSVALSGGAVLDIAATQAGITTFNSGRYIVSDSSITSVRVGALGGLSAYEVGSVTGQYVVDAGVVAQINQLVLDLDAGLSTLRSHAQTLGSNVALLQTRLDFTTQYVNLLTQGSGKLTLADLNEEGANLLALQTRQQLGIQALSFAGQAEQSILTLFN